MRGLGDCPLTFLEQPVAATDDAALARVRAASPVPISADESVFSLAQAAALARQDAVDVFSLKVSKNGGIAQTRKIAALAEGFGIGCLMNSMLECGITQAASLRLGLTLPNLVDCGHAYMSTLRLAEDVTDFSDWIAGGVASAPDRPGLGIEVDEAKLARLSLDRASVGTTRHALGSVA